MGKADAAGKERVQRNRRATGDTVVPKAGAESYTATTDSRSLSSIDDRDVLRGSLSPGATTDSCNISGIEDTDVLRGSLSPGAVTKHQPRKKRRRFKTFRGCECEAASCHTGGARPEDRHGDGDAVVSKADADHDRHGAGDAVVSKTDADHEDPNDSSSAILEGVFGEEAIREERAQNPEIRQVLMPLKTIEPQGLNPIVDSEWVEIDVAVDSGATETVMSAETLGGVIDITEGPAFVRGVQYEVANGAQTPNLGER